MSTTSTNENALKIIVQADKTMFGKRTGKFYARIGEFLQYGLNREHALECLQLALDRLYRHGSTRRYLRTPGGVVFVLFHSWNSWGYDILRPEYTNASTCLMSCDSEREAYEAMERYWKQMCQDEAATVGA